MLRRINTGRKIREKEEEDVGQQESFMGLRGGLFGIFFVHFLLMQRDGEQKIFFVNQQKRNLHEQKLRKDGGNYERKEKSFICG